MNLKYSFFRWQWHNEEIVSFGSSTWLIQRGPLKRYQFLFNWIVTWYVTDNCVKGPTVSVIAIFYWHCRAIILLETQKPRHFKGVIWMTRIPVQMTCYLGLNRWHDQLYLFYSGFLCNMTPFNGDEMESLGFNSLSIDRLESYASWIAT